MPRSARPAVLRQHSSGGVVVRRRGQDVDFLAIRPARSSRWQLPKGTIDAGETPQQTAVREVREEGGVDGVIVGDLQPIHYFYQSGGKRFSKTVDFFLMEYRNGDPAHHDREVDEARWMPLSKLDKLSFPSEREVVEQARTLLAERAL